MNDNRGPWYLITGLVMGVILGVLYSWAVRPVEYLDTAPASLREQYKDNYRILIASAYLSNGDLVRARARLELLEDPDIFRSLSEQAQRTLAQGDSPENARALGMLAVALGQGPGQGVAITPIPPTAADTATSPPPSLEPTFTGTPEPTLALTVTLTSTLDAVNLTLTPTPPPTTAPPPTRTPTPAPPTNTPVPTPTATFFPTFTPTRTPGGPFALQERVLVCEQDFGRALVQVQALDASGQPVPGVEVVVTWPGGEERFFTGLKPEIGLGYADFTLTPDITYTLRLGDGGQPITGLVATRCTGRTYWGAWLLTFTQP